MTDTSSETRTVGGLTKDFGIEPGLLAEDARRETADLERLRHWVNTFDETGWKDVEVVRLAAWMPRVARFSYRIEVC